MEKGKLTEEDVKLQFITPALCAAGWQTTQIRMERQITDGRVSLKGNLAVRERAKKADYVLCTHSLTPLAIVEAKDQTKSVSFGLQQAKEYAQMLDVSFAYASNGTAFEEYDFLTGKEREIALADFPSEAEITRRLEQAGRLTPASESVLRVPCYVSQTTYEPRYYQQVAIDRVLAAMARGQQRLLLVMATGTGKTYTAFQIVYRLLRSGQKKKILYLADRNILVDQSIQQDFAPLEKVIHKVNFARDRRDTITAYTVYFALYQQMVGEGGEAHYAALFRPEFFDFIIVDECHRGSAKEESRWRQVLAYFAGATQLGLTATPKETRYVSNIDYFGAPVYTYSLKQGIEDGFLAPFRVIGVHLNIGDGWRPRRGQRDAFGKLIPDRIYNTTDYDYGLVLTDRTREVAAQITRYLRATDPYQKTIVFCASEEAAERMRRELACQNADLLRENPDYVVRITGGDPYGKSKLDYFISVTAKYPVIATTSDLLSTGVDCKMVKLIAIDKNISSMTMFKQIVGRGTRLRFEDGKTSFTIMDFRGVTRLFADPDWDGPALPSPDFGQKKKGQGGGPKITPPDPPQPAEKYYVKEDGCRVYVTQKTVAIYDTDGKLLRQENIIDYTRENVRGLSADLAHFLRLWDSEKRKSAIAAALRERGIDLAKLKQDMGLVGVDDFDLLVHIAYDQKPLTRRERAEGVKKRDALHQYSGDARAVLELLLDRYKDLGISAIEQNSVLRLKDFQKFGTPSRIIRLFGGKEGYEEAVRELTAEIYRIG